MDRFEILIGKIEAISAQYAAKTAIERSSDWFLLKLQEELGELTAAHLKLTKRGRRGGLADDELTKSRDDELADLFCHTILYALHHDIDIFKAVEGKWLPWLQSH